MSALQLGHHSTGLTLESPSNRLQTSQTPILRDCWLFWNILESHQGKAFLPTRSCSSAPISLNLKWRSVTHQEVLGTNDGREPFWRIRIFRIQVRMDLAGFGSIRSLDIRVCSLTMRPKNPPRVSVVHCVRLTISSSDAGPMLVDPSGKIVTGRTLNQ